jgi:MFS family permease
MPGLTRHRRMLVLAICCMSLLIVGLDTTIVNVALPEIHRELRASVSGLQWIVDAYTLVLASLLMVSGTTADRRLVRYEFHHPEPLLEMRFSAARHSPERTPSPCSPLPG